MENSKYAEWIAIHVPNYAAAYGYCEQVTEMMLAAFPELKRVKGHYYCTTWGERGHWWLVAPDGLVVDPTAIQFPSKGTGTYVELDETEEQPCGMCANCGEYSYASKGGSETVCGESCEKAYIAYLNNPSQF